jgi:hypothetical protein
VSDSDAEESAIREQVRVLQDAYRRGDEDAANALLHHLFDDYGHQRVIDTMRWQHAGEQLAAEIELLQLFGPLGDTRGWHDWTSVTEID